MESMCVFHYSLVSISILFYFLRGLGFLDSLSVYKSRWLIDSGRSCNESICLPEVDLLCAFGVFKASSLALIAITSECNRQRPMFPTALFSSFAVSSPWSLKVERFLAFLC